MADMIFEEDYDNDGEMTSIVIVMMMMAMIKTTMMTMVNRNIFILSCGSRSVQTSKKKIKRRSSTIANERQKA